MITIKSIFHDHSHTFTHIVHDPITKDALIIDPVMDFDLSTMTISYESINNICSYLDKEQLHPKLIIDTHVHADHMSGAYALHKRLGIKTAIGRGFLVSQTYFAGYFDIDLSAYFSAYHFYFDDGQKFLCGSLNLTALSTPGHTPTCMSIVVEDAVFVGDALFQPALGCGRCDFPSGSAQNLYGSIINKLYRLPDHYRVFVGHDYPKDQKAAVAQTTIGQSKSENVMIHDDITLEMFIHDRQARDQHLSLPKLMNYVMQVNILGGQLPKSKHGKPILFMPLHLKE